MATLQSTIERVLANEAERSRQVEALQAELASSRAQETNLQEKLAALQVELASSRNDTKATSEHEPERVHCTVESTDAALPD